MLATGFVIMHYTTNMMARAVNNTQIFKDNPTAQQAVKAVGTTSERLDYMFLAFVIGLILMYLVIGWFSGGHPIFAPIYILFTIIAATLSIILSYGYDQLTAVPFLNETVASFPITNHVMGNFAYYIVAIAIMGLVIVFARPITQPEI
jgi:hypothetical protein